jgi:enterochelin esterase-like enzyme
MRRIRESHWIQVKSLDIMKVAIHQIPKQHLKVFVLLLFIGLCGCKKEPNPTEKPFIRLLEEQTIQSSILKRSVNYSVLLPENYNISLDSFPVVYLLHGFGDDESSWNKYGLIKFYSDREALLNVPMIFVMPQGFNSYYVNRYNGSFPYMDFFASELVPEIDSIFRTKKDKSQRAVMGYSMGGYGALVLPVMHPELFTIGVPLSMSFRTDEQYMAESDGAFNYQWGPIFGGTGTHESLRLTDYYKEYSPFHFFNENDPGNFSDLKFLIDCGDDEESLLITNNNLHCLMRDIGIQHEFRIRNGGHSWDYWHSSLKESLHFISLSFQGEEYTDNTGEIDFGTAVPAENIKILALTEILPETAILFPPGYDSVNKNYPVIYLFHDVKLSNRTEARSKLFQLLFNAMLASELPKSLVVEIPAKTPGIDTISIPRIIQKFDGEYKTVKNSRGRILIGNGEGGADAALVALTDTGSFNSCFLYIAHLPSEQETGREDLFYYLDATDKGQDYWNYFKLYENLKNKEMPFEYRMRQGDDSWLSFIKGLSFSFPVLKKKLSL